MGVGKDGAICGDIRRAFTVQLFRLMPESERLLATRLFGIVWFGPGLEMALSRVAALPHQTRHYDFNSRCVYSMCTYAGTGKGRVV